eukprot:2212171-Amphidinium_carterae.1
MPDTPGPPIQSCSLQIFSVLDLADIWPEPLTMNSSFYKTLAAIPSLWLAPNFFDFVMLVVCIMDITVEVDQMPRTA